MRKECPLEHNTVPPLQGTAVCVLHLTELIWGYLRSQPSSDPETKPGSICCVYHYTALYPGACMTGNEENSNTLFINFTK